MRELFDEVSGKSPLDPEEVVRRTTRGPRRKRFYANADVVETGDGFAITLDDKPIRTPSGRALVAPVREIADVMSAEWDAQKEIIDPLTMPFTRFANSVVDAVVERVDELVQEGIDDEGIALRAAFDGGVEACAARIVRTAIDPLIPEEMRPLVDFCLQYPHEDQSVSGVG